MAKFLLKLVGVLKEPGVYDRTSRLRRKLPQQREAGVRGAGGRAGPFSGLQRASSPSKAASQSFHEGLAAELKTRCRLRARAAANPAVASPLAPVMLKDSLSKETRRSKKTSWPTTNGFANISNEDPNAASATATPQLERHDRGKMDPRALELAKENEGDVQFVSLLACSECGKTRWIKVATFEDTGKCKGYGRVNFEEAEAAEWKPQRRVREIMNRALQMRPACWAT
ncbi:hypothetical protein B0T24DRAFT_598176 [Lasiosphaeria ovina]|uniref:Uncharacterized protein n=1 Tax=Lasiosphaeria ovina TaxID=92902 RepID=A0AAE0JV16_9PEZI|nr:hypothetical protein B0T24DRAFT_598176 [Lasiosphaeria ovina]